MTEERSAGRLATVLVVAAKSTKLLKVVKTAKVLKPAITLTSALGSVFVYAFSFGWPFGVGLVAMLFIHEMGHVWAFKRKGFKVSMPVFIPMVGAVIFAPRMDRRDDEAYCSIAGPVIGTLGALPFILGLIMWRDLPEVLALMAYLAVVLNLFNLIPLSPLDGGRVTQAVGPWFRWVGIGLLLAITFLTANPGMLLVWLLVMSDFAIPTRAKATLGVLLWVMMVVLLIRGAGYDQHWLIDIMDIVMGGVFVVLYVVQARAGVDVFVGVDKRPELPPRQRARWFAAFVAVVLFLVALLLAMRGHLPAQAR